jgi:hypothetical protein
MAIGPIQRPQFIAALGGVPARAQQSAKRVVGLLDSIAPNPLGKELQAFNKGTGKRDGQSVG